MNYIEEINEFYNRIEMMSLSKSAISLWHALMHMNNKAKWTSTFTVSLKILESKTGVKSKQLYKAREELVEAGMIEWHERVGNLCALYKLISLKDRPLKMDAIADKNGKEDEVADEEKAGCPDKNLKNHDGQFDLFDKPNGDANGDTNGDTNGDANGDNSGAKLGSINKQEETKQNKLEPIGSLSSADDLPCQNAVDVCKIYNLVCDRLPEAASLTNSRKQNLNRRLKEHGEQNVRKMLRLAAGSDFLAGDNNNSWVANIDWLFRASNFIKVLDGCYNMKPDFPSHRQPPNFSKPSVYEILKDINKL